MSIQVEPDELGEALQVYRFAYLITVAEGGRSHVVAVAPVLERSGEQQALLVTDLGRRTLANLATNPWVTLVWPPSEPAGHSLIVDGVATAQVPEDRPGTSAAPGGAAADAAGYRIAVSRAVLHRPAPAPVAVAAGSCTADCVEVVPRRTFD